MDKRVKNCLNRARKKLFKELSSKRFSISVFISKSIVPPFCGKDLLALLPTGFGESVIFQWKTRTVFASIVVISPLQRIISWVSRRGTFYGNVSLRLERKTGPFKRNTAKKVWHRTHQLKRWWTEDLRISLLKSLSSINWNITASLVDQNLGGTWISLFVVFTPNLKLHHLLFAHITKIHKIIFLFGSYVGFMSLDDLLSINFLSVDAALSRY